MIKWGDIRQTVLKLVDLVHEENRLTSHRTGEVGFPKVVGSNPTPAPNKTGVTRNRNSLYCSFRDTRAVTPDN
jgi:hypothetical protein